MCIVKQSYLDHHRQTIASTERFFISNESQMNLSCNNNHNIHIPSGPVSDIEGDEGVLVPEPGGAADGSAHQEDPRQHRRGGASGAQDVGRILPPSGTGRHLVKDTNYSIFSASST